MIQQKDFIHPEILNTFSLKESENYFVPNSSPFYSFIQNNFKNIEYKYKNYISIWYITIKEYNNIIDISSYQGYF